jgi:poly [ADP-ribose] polymerase
MTMTAVASAANTKCVKEARYVLTNLSSNNNKFWNIRLYADGSCETHWGRVGEDGQRKTFPSYTETAFDSKCREKEGKGYKPQKTLGNGAGKVATNDRLAEAAAEQIETNSPETMKLVTYLARVNVHRILEATTLQYDTSRGTFSTPLGIVTKDGIVEARELLGRIGGFVHSGDWGNSCFVPLLNDYLMLIPQNIGRAKPDPKALFPDLNAIQQQSSILDSLEASLQMALSAPAENAEEKPTPKLFEAKLSLVEDEAEIERIRRKYRATNRSMHACAHLDVKRVFRVEVATMARAFEETGKVIGNVQELWHGTRAGNLLSILKSGFVIPAANAAHCTGRMFGNGVYFSDQSTKSLNYAYGYWQGTREDNCFMFLCDVAMGKSYTPKSYAEKLPMAGYDSTFAKAGASGVANNEMIVYSTDRINPRYLIEFAPAGK